MIIFSFKEDFRDKHCIPDSSFYLEGGENLCFLIHGLTGTPKEMSTLGSRLHDSGYAVAVPLLLGHNGPLSVLKRQKWQEIYARVKEEYLKYEAGYKNIFIAGLSFGALLGLLLSLDFPKKIRGVVCISPTLFFDGWSTPKSRFLLPMVYRTPFKYNFYFKEEYPYGIKNERLRARIDRYYTKAKLDDYSQVHLYGYPVIPISCMEQNELLARHIISLLPKIDAPLQLLQARDDDITSPRNSYEIYNNAGSVDKELVFFEDSYHIITSDQERDKASEKITSFFNKHKA
ncbi:MAG: alpha/beta fold hydrolase [Candidatus Omnitrophota bacterium]